MWAGANDIFFGASSGEADFIPEALAGIRWSIEALIGLAILSTDNCKSASDYRRKQAFGDTARGKALPINAEYRTTAPPVGMPATEIDNLRIGGAIRRRL